MMYPVDAVTPFDLKVMEAQKERERIAIQAILTAKNQRITTVKTSSTSHLKEAEEGMYDKTNSVLPNNLKYGLEGTTAKAANAYLKAIPQLSFTTPMKRGQEMNDKMSKISQLEEQYEAERRTIQMKIQDIDEQLHSFKKETENVFEQVSYFTREDKIDLEKLNWQMMTIEEEVSKEGRNYCVQLDKGQDDLRRKLAKAIELVEEESREEMRKQENNKNNDFLSKAVTGLPHSGG